MWPPWVKIRSSDQSTASGGGGGGSPSSFCRSPSFFLSTLKDVQNLLCEDHDKPFSSSPATAAAPPSTTPSFRRVFHRVCFASSALRALRSGPVAGGDRRIVVYCTSLGVVRKTADDCRAVRSILRGYRVAVDERDLSMDAGFLAELKAALGPRRWGGGNGGAEVILPQVFIGSCYIGGADEIRRLHECGELRQLIKGALPQSVRPCEGCGGLRFTLCGLCSGSRKLHSESKDGFAGFRSCGECNQYGLVRCPDCFSGPVF